MSSLPPVPGPYNDMLNGYFGNYTNDVKSAIWQSFLETNQLPSDPDPASAANLKAFSTYINNYYDNLIGPDIPIVERTRIIWNIFDILIAMMRTMTKTQITSQQLQKYYLLKQQEYREEMKRTVLYMGTPINDPKADGDQTITTPNSDPALFNLGYGDITLQEVFTTLIAQAQQNYIMSQRNGTSNDAATFKLATSPRPQYLTYTTIMKAPKLETYVTLSVRQSSPGFYQLDVRLDTQEMTYPNETARKLGINGTVRTITPWNQSFPVSNTSSNGPVTFFKDMFYSMYNTYKGQYWEIAPQSFSSAQAELQAVADLELTNELYNNYVAMFKLYNLRINWLDEIKFTYVGSDNNKKNIYSTMAGKRGEFNKRSQSFIDANKSRSDTIKDFSNQQANTVDQASNGRQQTSSMLQSVLQQLQTIMNSIFKS